MNDVAQPAGKRRASGAKSIAIWLLFVGLLCATLYFAVVPFFEELLSHRSQALMDALASIGSGQRAPLASAIKKNFVEIRSAAVHWSAVNWTFTFGAAICSALAGLVIKLESPAFKAREAQRKDAAAILAMIAALLMSISTAGAFHDKWSANRQAAAHVERLGYEFIAAGDDVDVDKFWGQLGEILETRNMAISGGEPLRGEGRDAGRRMDLQGPARTESAGRTTRSASATSGTGHSQQP
jgi:hypothetical protein